MITTISSIFKKASSSMYGYNISLSYTGWILKHGDRLVGQAGNFEPKNVKSETDVRQYHINTLEVLRALRDDLVEAKEDPELLLHSLVEKISEREQYLIMVEA